MNLLAEPAVREFAFWYLVLVIKMLVLIFRTSSTRRGLAGGRRAGRRRVSAATRARARLASPSSRLGHGSMGGSA